MISFEFQIEDFEKPKLYKQYDPKNEETTYLLSYFKTNYENDNNNDINRCYPGLYYFIIDQSGSMAGKPMKIVIQTLKVFMQSLSKGSYYQLIGFGSQYKAYSNQPLPYTKENVSKTISEIEKLKGDMGGTELNRPLEYVYNCTNNKNLNLPQHIFILTDGYTENKQKALNLIEINNSRYQIYAYGIGNDFDKDFIRTAGECGFGSYKFIENIENLSIIINEQLKKCMRSYYDKVKFNVEKKDNNELIYEFYRNEFILENQLVNYSFVMKGKTNGNIDIKNSYNQDEKEFNEIFKFEENKIFNLKDGDILAKITLHSLIQKGEGEQFSKDEIIKKIAKKYQILCQFTSLYAEVENTQNIQEGNLKTVNIKQSNDKKQIGGLFGNNYNQTQTLFGNNNNQNQGLFGNNTNYNNNQSQSIFGNNTNYNNNQSQSIFGNNTNYYNNPTSLFGNNTNYNNNPTCLFGNNTNYNNNQNQGLFGNNNPSSSLFGNNKNNGGLFGNTQTIVENDDNKQVDSIFGNDIVKDNSLFAKINPKSNSQNNGISLFNNDIEGNLNLENLNKDSQIDVNNKQLYGNYYLELNKTPSTNLNDFREEKNNNNLNVDDNTKLENVIMDLDIIEGSWDENQNTKYIIDLKKNIYDKVKNLVNNNKIAVTFVILYYILNDKKEKIAEYSNIINKAKTFLFTNNCSYEFILSKI